MIGTMLAGGDDVVPARIDAGGFDRHTFLCGQSGSGKTYSLGVVLEQLLLNTELRVVVIDPNSDFVRLREARDDADPALAARLAELAPSILVRSPAAAGDDRLRIRFPELDGAAYAGVLQLDPIRDSDEYDELLRALEEGPGSPGLRGARVGQRDPGERGPRPADPQGAQPRRRPLRRLGQAAGGHRARRPRPRRLALSRRRHRHARHADREDARRPGRPLAPLGAPPRAAAAARRDRRGAQRLPAAPRGRAAVPRHRDGDQDRGGGAQVRALPPRLDAAAPEGAREHRLAVRQPAPDADELRGRRRPPDRGLLVRAAEPARRGRRASGRARRSSPARSCRPRPSSASGPASARRAAPTSPPTGPAAARRLRR